MPKSLKIVAVLLVIVVAVIGALWWYLTGGLDIGTSGSREHKVSFQMVGFRQSKSYPGLPGARAGKDGQDQTYAIMTVKVTVPVDSSIPDQRVKLLDALTKTSIVNEARVNKYGQREAESDNANVAAHTLKAVQQEGQWLISGDLVYLVVNDPAGESLRWSVVVQNEAIFQNLQN